MGFVKHGEGSILPLPEQQKTASTWTERDQAELVEESTQADGEQG